MSQNDENQDDTSSATNEGTKVTEEDLRKDKYGDEEVDDQGTDQDDTSDHDDDDEDSEDTGDDDGKTDDDDSEDDDSDDDSSDDSDDDDSEFVKEFPNIKGSTLVEYTRNLEATISKSNTEGKRLADENAALKDRISKLEAGDKGSDGSDSKGSDAGAEDNPSPEVGYIREKMKQEIDKAFGEFRKNYDQVDDPAEYQKFVDEVKILGETIFRSQKRYASPGELYSKAAVSLGWEPSNKVDGNDRLKVALKDKAAVSKTTSSTSKKSKKSKVTDKMIAVNRKMYPGKTDEEIRKELEPYVQ